jgi:hypothetical protein
MANLTIFLEDQGNVFGKGHVLVAGPADPLRRRRFSMQSEGREKRDQGGRKPELGPAPATCDSVLHCLVLRYAHHVDKTACA